jgi:hypothetical protein
MSFQLQGSLQGDREVKEGADDVLVGEGRVEE